MAKKTTRDQAAKADPEPVKEAPKVEAPKPEPVRRNIFNQPMVHDPSKGGIGFGDDSRKK